MGANDKIIVEAVLGGDREQYGVLVERYQRLLYAIAWSRLGDADASDDVVQEAFLQGFRLLKTLRRPERFGSWVAQIARNVCHTLQRQRGRRERLERQWALESPVVAGPTMPDDGEASISATLSDAMRSLDGQHREALVLFYFQKKSTDEAAAALGIPPSTYRARLHRARRALRVELERRLEDALPRMEPSPEVRGRVMHGIQPMALAPVGGFSLPMALLKIAPWLLQFAMMFGMVGFVTYRLAANLREGQEIQRRLYLRNFLVNMSMVGVAFAALIFAQQRWGVRAFYGIGILLFIPPALSSWRLYRLGQTGFKRANLAMNALLLVMCAICFAFNLSIFVFMAAFLPVNIFLYLGRKSQPVRTDYNLFLRAATGGLGDDDGGDESTMRPFAAPPGDLMKFAQAMGRLYLAMDARIGADGALHIFLPPVSPSPRQVMMPLPLSWLPSSYVTIDGSGNVKALIANRDRAQIARLTGGMVDAAALAKRVERAVAWALRIFLNEGDEHKAMACLERYSKEEVFKVAPHKLASQKFVYVASIVAAILLIFMLLILTQLR